MTRLLAILLLLAAPLGAVAPVVEKGATCTVSISEASVKIALAGGGKGWREGDPVSCDVTVSLKLSAPQDTDIVVELPCPNASDITGNRGFLNDQHLPAERLEKALRWTFTVSAGGTTFAWTRVAKLTRVMGDDMFGRYHLRVPLQHVKGWTAMPASFAVAIEFGGLRPELFDRETEGPIALEHTVTEGARDFALSFKARTRKGLQEDARRAIESVKESDRTAANTRYTAALVDLAEALRADDDREALLDTLTRLQTLEAGGGKAITHCGPWAPWRKYVPWSLQRMELLEAMGRTKDAAAVAAEAAAALQPTLELQAVAAGKPRPHEHFDEGKLGRYYDYDWDRTRKLFEHAQSLAKGGK